MFATYGALLLHGARPYVDFWDLHPPLVYVYWAFVQAITGTDWLRTCLQVDVLAPQSCTGLLAHFVDLLFSVVCALVVAAIVRRAGGSAIAAAVAALLVVGFADQVMLSQEGSNPSKLTLVPTSVAVWAYLESVGNRSPRRWAWLAGAAGALAVLAKQPALLTLLVLVGHAAVRRDRARTTDVLVGAGLMLAAVCVALAAIGSLDGFVAQAWIYNVERISIGYFVHPTQAPAAGLNRILTESGGSLVAFALMGLVVVGPVPRNTGQRLIVAWAAINVIAITAFREFVYVVPSFAALGALGLERVWTWPELRRARIPVVIGCTVILVLTTGFQRTQLARARFERGPHSAFSPTEELGLLLRSNLPTGPLFVYGDGAQLYPLANRAPATQYLNGEALRYTAPNSEQTRADLLARLRSDPPPLIVLAPHIEEPELNLETYPAMRAFLQECYAPQPISPSLGGSWTLFLRSGC